MESYRSNKAKDLEKSYGCSLEANTTELMKIREEVKTARERATQSWLDSGPLIDELERLKSGLESAKNQSLMSNTIISKLESQLRSTITSIKSKKEQVLSAKMTIETSQTVNRTREKMEKLKQDIDDEQQARLNMKQVLLLRKQTLQTLHLMLRAVQLKTEAFGASAAEAVHHINCSEKGNTIIQLSHERYHALTRRAEEETVLADRRVLVSTEQKLVAQASQNLAFSRLNDSNTDSKLQRGRLKGKKKMGAGFTKQEAAKQNPGTKVEADNRRNAFTKAKAKPLAPSNHGKPPQSPQQFRRSKRNNNKRSLKKKASILHKTRNFIARKITRLFR